MVLAANKVKDYRGLDQTLTFLVLGMPPDDRFQGGALCGVQVRGVAQEEQPHPGPGERGEAAQAPSLSFGDQGWNKRGVLRTQSRGPFSNFSI